MSKKACDYSWSWDWKLICCKTETFLFIVILGGFTLLIENKSSPLRTTPGTRCDCRVSHPLDQTILYSVYSCCKSGVREQTWGEEARALQLSGAQDKHGQTREPAAVGARTGTGNFTPPPRWKDRGDGGFPPVPSLLDDNVAKPGGSSAEKRPEALGDREEQRLLPPAEEKRPRRAHRKDHR